MAKAFENFVFEVEVVLSPVHMFKAALVYLRRRHSPVKTLSAYIVECVRQHGCALNGKKLSKPARMNVRGILIYART